MHHFVAASNTVLQKKNDENPGDGPDFNWLIHPCLAEQSAGNLLSAEVLAQFPSPPREPSPRLPSHPRLQLRVEPASGLTFPEELEQIRQVHLRDVLAHRIIPTPVVHADEAVHADLGSEDSAVPGSSQTSIVPRPPVPAQLWIRLSEFLICSSGEQLDVEVPVPHWVPRPTSRQDFGLARSSNSLQIQVVGGPVLEHGDVVTPFNKDLSPIIRFH
jgi:hypothetical protein